MQRRKPLDLIRQIARTLLSLCPTFQLIRIKLHTCTSLVLVICKIKLGEGALSEDTAHRLVLCVFYYRKIAL